MKRWVVGALMFFCLVLLYTRMDYLTHTELYNFGLRFSDSWFVTSQIVYVLLYQSAILLIYLYTKSIRLALFSEAFVLSSSQDLIFFGLWNGGVFPTQNWTWTEYYTFFGVWNTSYQIAFSCLALLTVSSVLLISNTRARSFKIKTINQKRERA